MPVTAPEEVRPPLKVVKVEVVAPRPVTVARVSASVAVRVNVPPKETNPPPVRIPEELMVRLELASSVLPISPFGKLTVPEETVRPVRPVRVPEATILSMIDIFPVVSPPRVRVWFLVVWIVPVVSKAREPEVVALPVAEKIWNLALEVAVPPMVRSSVMFRGETTPRILCQLELPPPLAAAQEGIPAETVRTWPVEPTPSLARVLVAEEYRISPVV